MAIDTQAKRLSITHFLMPGYPAGGDPDGSVDQADRQSFSWFYSGLLAAVVAAVTPNLAFLKPSFTFSAYVPVAKLNVKKPSVSFTFTKIGD